jgi:hypothetical protein
MCRSIKTLRTQETVTDEEVRAAALQFVRKVSGYRAPSATNREAFDSAVGDIGVVTQRLLDEIAAKAAPRPA